MTPTQTSAYIVGTSGIHVEDEEMLPGILKHQNELKIRCEQAEAERDRYKKLMGWLVPLGAEPVQPSTILNESQGAKALADVEREQVKAVMPWTKERADGMRKLAQFAYGGQVMLEALAEIERLEAERDLDIRIALVEMRQVRAERDHYKAQAIYMMTFVEKVSQQTAVPFSPNAKAIVNLVNEARELLARKKVEEGK